jgi:hypothetical protein
VRRQCDCLRCYIFLLRVAHNYGIVWWDCEYRRSMSSNDPSSATRERKP